MFDRVIVADWSASAKPTSKGKDAIWIGQAGPGTEAGQPRHVPSRAEAERAIAAMLGRALAAGQRALVGLDFAFGYPAGFAARLTGRAEAAAVWAELALRIEDGPDNTNNRFHVAAGINAAFGGAGPFWGRPPTLPLPTLPTHRPPLPDGLARHRIVEARLRAASGPGQAVKSVWQIFYTGSVGGQVLVGLPFLHRLKLRFGAGIAVWPFEPPDAPLVVAEVYPALIDRAVAVSDAHPVKDAKQAQLLAEALAGLADGGGLAPLFTLPADLAAGERRAVCAEEGWILGTGHARALAGALSRRCR
jgi:hypothetical protein